MGNNMDNFRIDEIINQFIDVLPYLLYVFMLGFRDIQGEDVDLAMVFGKIGRNFFADECSGKVGDFQCAVDTVVIAYSDQIHTANPGNTVDVERFSETLGTSDLLKNPLRWAFRKLGMHVQVDPNRMFFHLSPPFRVNIVERSVTTEPLWGAHVNEILEYL
jgi:hypothetical protein